MANCKKLIKYLKEKRGTYEFSRIEKFLTKCCGMEPRQGGKATHIIFYPKNEAPNDVRTQITICKDHSNKSYVKKEYVEDMWKDLERLGIEPMEDSNEPEGIEKVDET